MNFLSDGPSSALLLKPAHYVIGKSSEKELFISLFSKFCVTFIFITPLKSLVLKRPRLSSLLTLLLAIRFISKGGIGRLIWIFQGELIIGHVLKLVHTKDSRKLSPNIRFTFFVVSEFMKCFLAIHQTSDQLDFFETPAKKMETSRLLINQSVITHVGVVFESWAVMVLFGQFTFWLVLRWIGVREFALMLYNRELCAQSFSKQRG